MPAQVTEDELELTIDLLEAGLPTSDSYPLPSLQLTGRNELRKFRTLTIESPFLRATVLPDLGGRIIRLQDLVTGADILPYSGSIQVRQGGLRGAQCPDGIQVVTSFSERLNSMGTVANSPDFRDDSEEPTGVWLAELCGNGLGLHWRYSITEDGRSLEIEVRAHNRTFGPIAYNGGVLLGPGFENIGEGQGISARGSSGSLHVDGLDFATANSIHRFNRMRQLGPRQLDSWTLKLTPYSVGDTLKMATNSAATGWDSDRLYIQSHAPLQGKVVVRTVGDGPLEVPLAIESGQIWEAEISDLPGPIDELVVLDGERREVLRASRSPVSAATEPGLPDPPDELLSPEDEVRELRDATFSLSQRHLAHLLLGYRAFAKRDFQTASKELEQSLLFNAEDHLAWWAKAVADRMVDESDSERPELLNAHFLAPLEPAIRAEGFLGSAAKGKDKAAVLNPLAEIPEQFVEVGALLLEMGLYDQAATWLDEALRHIDMPLLRYLLAFAQLQLGRMEVEAADNVRLAGQGTLGPPFPWRPIELKALRAVHDRFPDDPALAGLLKIGEDLA